MKSRIFTFAFGKPRPQITRRVGMNVSSKLELAGEQFTNISVLASDRWSPPFTGCWWVAQRHHHKYMAELIARKERPLSK